jgi:replicative DNA helicase
MAKIDLDFFEKVLFINMLKKDTLFLASVVDHLDKKLFKDKNIGNVVDIIKTFYLEHNIVPSVSEIKVHLSTAALKNSFKDAVEGIRGMEMDYELPELIKNTEYFLIQRKYLQLVEKAVEMQSENKEIDSDELQKEMEKIHAISLIDDLGLDFFAENTKVVEYLMRKENLLSTGYKGLDSAFGGIQREGKAFYVIGGETNVGKSIVLGNVAVNVLLQNLNVLIYTLEMSEMRYAKRISSMLTGLAIATLPDNITNYQEYIADFVSKYKSRLIIKEFPTKSVSPKHLYAYTKMLERKKHFQADFLAFDYHLLLKSSVSQPSVHATMQHITQECRGLTYAFEAPGMSVAQLNRGSHKNAKPGLDNTSGSWDMISDEDGRVNIAQTDQDREASIIRYAGEKVRDGAKGNEGILDVDYDTLRLSENNPHDEDAGPEVDDMQKNLSSVLDINDILS